MDSIIAIHGCQILDSRGNPTAEVTLADGLLGWFAVHGVRVIFYSDVINVL